MWPGVADRATVSRRAALSVFAGGALAACSTSPASPGVPEAAVPVSTGPVALPYGADPSQFGELTIPLESSTTLVVLIHGGFWFDFYDLDLGPPARCRSGQPRIPGMEFGIPTSWQRRWIPRNLP